MIFRVLLSKRAQKDLKKVPNFIRDKLEAWVQSVKETGLEEVRKVPAYHVRRLKEKERVNDPSGSTVLTGPFMQSCKVVQLNL